MAARAEALLLYRHFIRLRYKFPNKRARCLMRSWTTYYFRTRQLEYEYLVQSRGITLADLEAENWRDEARRDLEIWRLLAASEESIRRDITNRIAQQSH